MEINKYIQNAQSGDQSAFTFLLNKYWYEVYSFMLVRTENETITEDITIETFAKAFDKINQYNTDFQFNTWLISIAKNVHIDLIRKNKNNLFVEINEENQRNAHAVIDASPSIEDEIITAQNLSSLLGCIKQLKPQYQEIIQLRYFQEMTYQQIALAIDEPLSSVKIKLLRAKRLLAEVIKSQKS